MRTIKTFSTVQVTILNNHSGAEEFLALVIMSEACAGSDGEAYLKIDKNEWMSCSANICYIDGSLSAYIDPLTDLFTDMQIATRAW